MINIYFIIRNFLNSIHIFQLRAVKNPPGDRREILETKDISAVLESRLSVIKL